MRSPSLLYTSPSCFLTSNKNSWSVQKPKVKEMKILRIRKRYNYLYICKCRRKVLEISTTKKRGFACTTETTQRFCVGTPECSQLWGFWCSVLFGEEHFDILSQGAGACSPPPLAWSLKLNHQVFPPPSFYFAEIA